MYVRKGCYGYIKNRKVLTCLFTLACFGVSLALFLIGWHVIGTKKNLWTVIAVLGCLPGAKSAVNAIMFLKAKGCSAEAHERILPHVGALCVYYDLQFTSYERTYQVDSLVIEGKNICGYTGSSKCRPELCEKHLRTQLEQSGHKDYTVKIFSSLDKYIDRLDGLRKESASSASGAVKEQLLALAL
ncbi:MAG: hypothetical protein NC254_01285 [bacterium]|nr:hypothetical protein [bacterium]